MRKKSLLFEALPFARDIPAGRAAGSLETFSLSLSLTHNGKTSVPQL